MSGSTGERPLLGPLGSAVATGERQGWAPCPCQACHRRTHSIEANARSVERSLALASWRAATYGTFGCAGRQAQVEGSRRRKPSPSGKTQATWCCASRSMRSGAGSLRNVEVYRYPPLQLDDVAVRVTKLGLHR